MTAAPVRPRDGYREISLYAPDRRPCRIDLSDNTNAWGVPPAARDAIAGAAPLATRYPTLYADALKEALSAYTGVPAAMITTGCGSDDVLDSIIRAFGEAGDSIAFPAPTFPMIPIFARMNGLRAQAMAMTPDLDVDLDAIVGANARLIYLCSPNNPTGRAIERGDIEEIIRRTNGDQVILIDEAYAEFAGRDCVDLVRRCDRVLITRTMSKAFGLAGLRVGYALGAPGLIAEVEKSRGPYKVSAIAERVAVAALTAGLSSVREHVEAAIANRDRLQVALADRGFAPIPSAANFVFVPVERPRAIAQAMREREVAVRPFDEPRGLRFTVAPWPVLEEALNVFDEARRECE